jgi:uncharacterized protein (UPF0261 family)
MAGSNLAQAMEDAARRLGLPVEVPNSLVSDIANCHAVGIWRLEEVQMGQVIAGVCDPRQLPRLLGQHAALEQNRAAACADYRVACTRRMFPQILPPEQPSPHSL